MLKLYAIPVSLYCAKLRIVLRHKETEWEEVPPPSGYGSDEYKRIVSSGNLPALDHNGLLLGDSEAIAEYLNEAFPNPEMLPGSAGERAKIRERSRFHDTRLEPALRALFPHIKRANRDAEFVSQQWGNLHERLGQLVPLCPETTDILTLGDCGFPITCTWIEELAKHFAIPVKVPNQVQEYLSNLSQHAAVKAELVDYRPQLTDWLSQQ